MDIQVSTGRVGDADVQALAVAVFKDEQAHEGFLQELDAATGGLIKSVIESEELKGKEGETGAGGVPKSGPGQSPDFRAVRTGTHKYVEYDNGEVELYDLEADPYELESIHESADPALVEDLKAKLEALKGCSEEGCREAEDSP